MKKLVELCKLSISLFLFLMLISPIIVNAEDNSNEYIITKYDINIKVNENNTFNINEEIETYFKIQKHGIFRSIPYRNKVERLDGTTTNNVARISDIKVSDKYSIYNENGNKVIKIGDSKRTITGSKTYKISYLYNIGKDRSKDYDEFYFNIIGDEWDTTIEDITFTIEMPKEFDKTKVGFSSGTYKTIGTDDITYEIIDRTIIGEYNGNLNPGEALTIRLELPDGYFVGAGIKSDAINWLLIVLPIIFASISGLLWYKYGRDEEVVETVEFYPPNGFNSAEVAFLYNGNVKPNNIVSLLIYLANKGYLKIEEVEKKGFLSRKKDFKIIKLKDYDGDNNNERKFFNGLFLNAKQSKANNLPEVTSADLRDSFYVVLNDIVKDMNKKENLKKIYEKNTFAKRIIVIIMTIITLLLITIKPMLEYGQTELLFFALVFPIIGIIIVFSSITESLKVTKIFGTAIGLMFTIGSIIILLLPTLTIEIIYLYAYIIGIISIGFMILFAKYMLKRTKYGNEMLGKIGGFKNFLEQVEKPKLEELVMEDPKYFYNILPYTYVLGVSDKWIKKFETIAIQSPDWYSGSDAFNVGFFGGFITSTMSEATKAMTYHASSSGDGFSGGGFSGGGSGGGGGGSW